MFEPAHFPLRCFLVILLLATGCSRETNTNKPVIEAGFQRVVIDPVGPRAAWGKSVGDMNGDGLPDLLVGGHSASEPSLWGRVLRKLGRPVNVGVNGDLVWYQNPGWQKHLISNRYAIRTDLEVADLNGDGNNDVIAPTDDGLVVFYGPDWQSREIDSMRLHDVEIADFDADGDLDIVARNQSLFGYDNGNALIFYRQDAGDSWHVIVVAIPHGEGLALADMNNDGRQDAVVNQQWLENPGTLQQDLSWPAHDYAVDWHWSDVFIDTGDFNSDGRTDIVLAPAEPANQFYRMSWFQAPAAGEQWQERVIDSRVEAVSHFVAAVDINHDGIVDVVTAEMNQGSPPNGITAYLNKGRGEQWGKRRIADIPSHSMRALDIDGDFDMDLFGAEWHFEDQQKDYPVTLWINQAADAALWPRTVIDADRPGKALLVMSADLNADSYPDVVTGAYWYENPGATAAPWVRHDIGKGANNVAVIDDFDQDGRPDIFASSWHGDKPAPSLYQRLMNRLDLIPFDYDDPGNRFVWARNLGDGKFAIHNNIEAAKGDYLQGAGRIAGSSQKPAAGKIVLSWHKAGYGVQALTVPSDPKTDVWPWQLLSADSQDEAVSIGDIDNDGEEDIALGTQWLRREASDLWATLTLFETSDKPDRNQLVDMNGDGKLDIVVGYEAISRSGRLAWYEQPDEVTGLWREHLIGSVIGPMSLSAVDMDHDGDVDVLVGEHNLAQPEQARLILFENREGQWHAHLLSRGDEHHNGVHTVDIDGDRDLDIVSIGWGHKKVLLYQNPDASNGTALSQASE